MLALRPDHQTLAVYLKLELQTCHAGKFDIKILSIKNFRDDAIRTNFYRNKNIENSRSIIDRVFDMIIFDIFQ